MPREQSDSPATASAANNDTDEGGLRTFANSFWSSIKQPYDGAGQLAGKQPDIDMNSGFADTAGEISGTALLYIASTEALKRVPGIGRFAPAIAGGTLGFLRPVDPQQSLASHFADAGIGAGTALGLQHLPTKFGKLPGLNKEAWHSRLGQVALSNTLVGATGLQAQSFVHTGHLADLKETATGSGVWAITGSAFGARGIVRGNTAPESGISATSEQLTKWAQGTRNQHLATETTKELSNST